MYNLRQLTKEEINYLASRKNVKVIAVENFLMDVTSNGNICDAYSNLELDARLYKWNASTVKAIQDGIEASAGRKTLRIKK
jgi:hypothetical protein